MKFKNSRSDFGFNSREIDKLLEFGLREDEIRYLAWLKRKNEINKRRQFR